MTSTLRLNILIVAFLSVLFVCGLAWGTEMSSEVIAGLAGTVLGILGTVAKELISPDGPGAVAQKIMYGNDNLGNGCEQCKHAS